MVALPADVEADPLDSPALDQLDGQVGGAVGDDRDAAAVALSGGIWEVFMDTRLYVEPMNDDWRLQIRVGESQVTGPP